MLPNFRERPGWRDRFLPRTRQSRRGFFVFLCLVCSALYMLVFVVRLFSSSSTIRSPHTAPFSDENAAARPTESIDSAKEKEEPPKLQKDPLISTPQPRDPYSVKIPYVLSKTASSAEVSTKRDAIRMAFKHAYNGYEKQCMGNGELKPVSGKNWLADKMGLTIIDGLDTMLIMGLDDEYRRGRDFLMTNLDWDKNISVLVFEMNIRCLGGLLSAYALTEDEFYLEKAKDLGNRLLPAFQTPTGIPRTSVNLKTGTAHSPKWSQGNSVLADVGSLQLEFAALSRYTKDPVYETKAMGVFQYLRSRQPHNKLYPTFINPDSGNWGNHLVSIGALGDSFYEYLLKYWLLTSKKATEIGDWYFETADAISRFLASKYGNDMYYVRMMTGTDTYDEQMDHLACYAGATFALGSTLISDAAKADSHMKIGKGIARFCYEMYRYNPSGLPCDSYRVDSRSTKITPVNGALGYIERPEAVESWFYLYRITKDPIYREWGWSFFEAIQTTKTEFGYSGVRDARKEPSNFDFDDEQQSFFLAETLKYLYLLFSEDDVIPLDRFVFNTEAHPLPVFSN